MSLAAGKLDKRVILQEQSVTQDPDTGEQLVIWVDVIPLWAHIRPISAREFRASAAKQAETTVDITIRYRNGLTAKMRFLHKGKIYNIHGLLPDEKSGVEYLTIPCSEGTNDGQ